MDRDTKLLGAAERLFDRHGFTATGMDRLVQAAGMSSRTLYKHAGSKTALMAAVLAERDRRFFDGLEPRSVDALFAALEDWIREEGARGCLFLRTYAETGGDTPEIAAAMHAHKVRLRAAISDAIAAEAGVDPDAAEMLGEQLLVLYEGATAAAVYRGPDAVAAARGAAATLTAALSRRSSA